MPAAPAEHSHFDAFTSGPTIPEDAALVTGDLPGALVVRDDEAVPAETNLLAEQPQAPKVVVDEALASGGAILLGDRGNALPNFLGRLLSLGVRRALISDETGRGKRHIGNAELLPDAGLATVKFFQVTTKGRAVMRPDTLDLLTDLARLQFRRHLGEVVGRAAAAIDRGIVESENAVFDKVSDNWRRIKGILDSSPGLAALLDPVATFMNANADKAAETHNNREIGRDIGREEGRLEERARIQSEQRSAPAPAPTVTIHPGASAAAPAVTATMPGPAAADSRRLGRDSTR